MQTVGKRSVSTKRSLEQDYKDMGEQKTTKARKTHRDTHAYRTPSQRQVSLEQVEQLRQTKDGSGRFPTLILQVAASPGSHDHVLIPFYVDAETIIKCMSWFKSVLDVPPGSPAPVAQFDMFCVDDVRVIDSILLGCDDSFMGDEANLIDLCTILRIGPTVGLRCVVGQTTGRPVECTGVTLPVLVYHLCKNKDMVYEELDAFSQYSLSWVVQKNPEEFMRLLVEDQRIATLEALERLMGRRCVGQYTLKGLWPMLMKRYSKVVSGALKPNLEILEHYWKESHPTHIENMEQKGHLAHFLGLELPRPIVSLQRAKEIYDKEWHEGLTRVKQRCLIEAGEQVVASVRKNIEELEALLGQALSGSGYDASSLKLVRDRLRKHAENPARHVEAAAYVRFQECLPTDAKYCKLAMMEYSEAVKCLFAGAFSLEETIDQIKSRLRLS